jgi:hypothetical protein
MGMVDGWNRAKIIGRSEYSWSFWGMVGGLVKGSRYVIVQTISRHSWIGDFGGIEFLDLYEIQYGLM